MHIMSERDVHLPAKNPLVSRLSERGGGSCIYTYPADIIRLSRLASALRTENAKHSCTHLYHFSPSRSSNANVFFENRQFWKRCFSRHFRCIRVIQLSCSPNFKREIMIKTPAINSFLKNCPEPNDRNCRFKNRVKTEYLSAYRVISSSRLGYCRYVLDFEIQF